MKNIIAMTKIILALSLVGLAGCSYMESYFPDKERDYQYTTEIPLLNWPKGLRENKANVEAGVQESPATTLNAQGEEAQGLGGDYIDTPPPASGESERASSSATQAPSSAVDATEVTSAESSDQQDTLSSVELVKYDDGESRLRLGAGFAKAWRVVNKALTHNTIEVTQRNHDQGFVTIQYDPDEKKVKDEGFMDEVNFIFHGLDLNYREYNLKFDEHGDKTDVIALDDEHVPLLNDNDALRLLKLLAETVKADLEKKQGE